MNPLVITANRLDPKASLIRVNAGIKQLEGNLEYMVGDVMRREGHDANTMAYWIDEALVQMLSLSDLYNLRYQLERLKTPM